MSASRARIDRFLSVIKAAQRCETRHELLALARRWHERRFKLWFNGQASNTRRFLLAVAVAALQLSLSFSSLPSWSPVPGPKGEGGLLFQQQTHLAQAGVHF